MNKTKNDDCFVIMPFGEWFDEYYINIYMPAITESNLNPVRADDLYRPSSIIHDIWEFTLNSKIILADLTGKNPNVFYELGLAHAIAKPVILITQNMSDIPFDLSGLRVLLYNKNHPNWGLKLKREIKTAIKEVLASPLKSVPPTFIKTKPTKKTIVTDSEKEIIGLRQDIESMKKLAFNKAGLNDLRDYISNRDSKLIELTDKQIETLKLISEGKTQLEISEILGLNLSSIEKRMKVLKQLFNVNNTRELIIKFYELNL